MAAPLISVIMASRDGTDTLGPVFDALAKCEEPAGGVEFLLVDNASSDGTLQAMQAFAQGRDAQAIEDPRPGKSFALNTALALAKGELIVFIDDDVIPTAGWLRAYLDAARKYPAAGVFAGQLRPRFLTPAPAWLEHLADLGRSCACTPLSQAEGPCAPALAKGGNWALRRSAIGDERFDEGRNNLLRGNKSTGGQDTEMAGRIQRLGAEVVFVPAALAFHQVQPHEMTKRAIFERYRRIGRGIAAQGARGRVASLLVPFEIAVSAVLAVLGFTLGAQGLGGTNLTRLGSRVGQMEYLLNNRGD